MWLTLSQDFSQHTSSRHTFVGSSVQLPTSGYTQLVRSTLAELPGLNKAQAYTLWIANHRAFMTFIEHLEHYKIFFTHLPTHFPGSLKCIINYCLISTDFNICLIMYFKILQFLICISLLFVLCNKGLLCTRAQRRVIKTAWWFRENTSLILQ